jgi:ABC-type sugar transport system ATPase subunit
MTVRENLAFGLKLSKLPKEKSKPPFQEDYFSQVSSNCLTNNTQTRI